MAIDSTKAVGLSMYVEQTYYFCSAGCKRNFDTDPAKYLSTVKPDIRQRVAFKNVPTLALRLTHIVRIVAREFLAYRRFSSLSLEQRADSRLVPAQFVKSLLDLGPTFIKLGQILSTRPDLLPAEYVAALAMLQERVPPFAFADVKVIIEESLGPDFKQIFQSFGEIPVASASLSQVHLALLPDGTEVAVKVQRPHVRETINGDLIVLSWTVTALSWLFPSRVRRLNLVDGLQEFSRYTLHELDFTLEGATLERFRENFQAWEDVVFPTVFWDFTSPKVLTMSRLSGLRLNEAVSRLSVEERRRLNRRLMEMEMKMFISDGFFHADLHPGNVFFGPDGKIFVLDVGMVGDLTNSQRDRFLLYMLATAQRQTRRAFYHLVKQTQRLEGADEAGFYQSFKQMAEAFYASTLAKVSLAQVYLRIILSGAQFGFVFPSNLLLHAKAITTAEALAFTLVPDLKFDEAIRPIIAREFFQRAFDADRLRRKAEHILPELILVGELLPETAQDDDREDISTDFLWTTAAKELSSAMNRFEQSAGLMKTVVNPFAWKVLSSCFNYDEVKALLERTWIRYLDLQPSVPDQKTLGARFVVNAGAAIIAMYESMLALGQTKDQSSDLVYQIAWEVYTVMGDLPWFVGGTFTQDRFKRLKLATDAFRSFPFGSPAYLWQDVDAGESVVAFDCLRCPAAEFFDSHNLSELCVRTFCNLDFPLAEQWGAKLERTGTIASGRPRCDFRWKPIQLQAIPDGLMPLNDIANG